MRWEIRPVLQELHNSAQELKQDQSLSQDERHARHKSLVETADRNVREVLTEDQKKLDELERESRSKGDV